MSTKKSVKRLLEIDETSKRVTIMDNRYYTRNGQFYPSVTSILQFMPKIKLLCKLRLKDVGHNSDVIMRKAADEGTQVHDAIERYLLGEKITLIDDRGFSQYSMFVWQMILKFHDFWSTYKPTLVESEAHFILRQILICRYM